MPNVQGRWKSILLFFSLIPPAALADTAHIHFKHGPLSRIRLAAYGYELEIAVHKTAASKQQTAAGDKYGCAD